MHIFLLNVPAMIDNMDDYINMLSYQRAEKVKRLKNVKSKLANIFSELMIKYLVNKELSIDYDKIQFNCNQYGKPHVMGLENFHYNISHSADYIVCAVHKKSIGIDMERVRNININISERFFSKYEYNYINQREDKTQAFFDIWTLKESIIKADGRGMNIPLSSFSAVDCNYNIKTVSQDIGHEYFLKQYNNVLHDYKIAVCSPDDNFEDKIVNLDYKDLLKKGKS